MVSNLYLKFSELQLLFSHLATFTVPTSSAILTEFLSSQGIIDISEEELLTFITEKSKSRVTYISKTTELLKKAAWASYRLDKYLYEPLNITLASSFNCIDIFKKEIKVIDDTIEKIIKGMNPNALIILKLNDDIVPVFAAGIIAEIGDINAFHSSDALAKYAGLTWSKNQSGNFDAEDTGLQKAENAYLRFYLSKAAIVFKDTFLNIGTTTLKIQ